MLTHFTLQLQCVNTGADQDSQGCADRNHTLCVKLILINNNLKEEKQTRQE